MLPNDFELRVNIQNVYDQMTLRVRRGHHYRIRMIWQNQERQVIRRQTNIVRSLGEWMDPESFELFYEAFVNMFVSNEQLNVFLLCTLNVF